MIKKLKWKNYLSFGNLELDFSKPNGTAYNTIVLAGENGTGKTTILETLSAYLDKRSLEPFEYLDYIVDGKEYHIIADKNRAGIGFHKRIDVETGEENVVRNGKNNNELRIEEDNLDLRHYGFAYSKARSGFITNPVTSSTTLQIDNDKYEPDIGEDFTRIKQLLIDIESQDSSEWMKKSQGGGINDQKFFEFKRKSKGYRFEKAFNDFFDSMEYKGVDNDNPIEKKVLFEKYGRDIAVDQLSTGEKQIVFRGAHLLRNSRSIAGGTVLIDEPELSMHPIWQKKILDYYRGLFTSNNNQYVQMIIATHSEYVLQSALKDRDDVLVIVLTDDNGTIRCKNITAPNVLPTITSAETNYLAFGVSSTDYHIALYAYLQTKTGNHNIEACDRYIEQQPQYDAAKHEKIDTSYPGHSYRTLSTYIRNAIDHPDNPSRSYSEEELRTSIELLIKLCR